LIEEYLRGGHSFENAVRDAIRELRGIFALAIINCDEPDTVIAVRQGPPVVIASETANFLSLPTFPRFCNIPATSFLGDGEIAILTSDACASLTLKEFS